MPRPARIVLALALLALAGCFAFGFLATFEPGEFRTVLIFRIVYGILFLATLAASGFLIFRRPRA